MLIMIGMSANNKTKEAKMKQVKINSQGEFDSLPGEFAKKTKINIAGKITSICNVPKNADIDICGEAWIGSVSGSAVINHVYGAARIDSVYGSARIGYVSDSARIGHVYGAARIDHVYGEAIIDSVSGEAIIYSVSGAARIGEVQQEDED
jgi:hypothetical protein